MPKDDMVSRVMKQMGRKGGKKRMAALTPDERKALASKAGKASGKARRAKGKDQE